MPPDLAPPPASSHREQAAALMAFGAALRRQGAGPAALKAALQEQLATLAVSLIEQAELNTIVDCLASIPPRLVTRAIDTLLQGKGALQASALSVPVHSATSISRDIPDSVDWLAEPWAAVGALTAITGRPKIGKTTFCLDLIAAFLDGRPFLNYPTAAPPFPRGEGGQGVRSVVYLTEQQPSSFRASLARSDLLSQDALTVLFWHEAMALPWPAVAAIAGEQCRTRGARLLVVDTLSQWAGMRGDMENQAGDAFEALQPLQQLASTGVAVVFLQHERKSGGDAADAGRGSSAFAGAVDTLISFRNPPSYSPFPRGEGGQGVRSAGQGDRSGDGSVRLLLALSRFEAVPPELYIQRQDGRYTVLGQTPDFAAQNAKTAILSALRTQRLPSPLAGEGPGMRGDDQGPPEEAKEPGMRGDEQQADSPALTTEQLMQLTGTRRFTAAAALEALLATGQISRTGTGAKGSPYRYSAENSFLLPIE